MKRDRPSRQHRRANSWTYSSGNAMGTLNINLLGTSFSIQAKEDDRYLAELLARYKNLTSYIERMSGLKDNVKIAIMAGISLCDEIKQIKQKYALPQNQNTSNKDDTELIEAERIALKIMERIDKVLP